MKTISDIIKAIDDQIDKGDTTDIVDRSCNIGLVFAQGILRSMTEGMVLVPKEPTEAMKDAGMAAHTNWATNDDYTDLREIVYKAMLQATEGSNNNG